MKSFYITVGLLLLTGATALADDTTKVQNGSNSATITQSGPQGDTQKSVQRIPGHTVIEQHSGSNSAVITQDSNPKAVGPGQMDIDPDDMPDEMPVRPPRSDAANQTDADIYDAVRERASPQGRSNLDRLMNILGLGTK